jgi:tRNA modification GTPase
MAAIEASTDFSDEVGEADGPALAARLSPAEEAVDFLARQAAYGQAVFSGWKIAIVGPPNAGKSSLLNAVLGFDRAIVTPIPGTTRDTLAEKVEISGFPCLLVDTAGLRETPDMVESMGIERALQERESADLVWDVFDASLPAPGSDGDPRILLVANKIDLAPAPPGAIGVSCLSGEGLAALIEATSQRLPAAPSSPVLPRHLPLLEGARDRIREAAETLRSPLPPDLAVVMLQGAVRMLGEITGETAPPDVIEQIFRDFCIGK